MRYLRRAVRLAAVTVCLFPAIGQAQTFHKPRRNERLPADYAAWTRVADCESGGWQVLGPAYPDSLGITAANYRAFGGRVLPIGPVPTLAGRIAQIKVADRLVRAYHMHIPDQAGVCAAW